ncbi:MAG: hypothetical protein WA840_18180 [Caulobacteraceae bacterium]
MSTKFVIFSQVQQFIGHPETIAHEDSLPQRMDALLDEALEESFPASDPISSMRSSI